jgi:hypothetical protein
VFYASDGHCRPRILSSQYYEYIIVPVCFFAPSILAPTGT